MGELYANEGYNAAPYLLVVVFCVFWLVISMLQRGSAPTEKKAPGSHAAWRVSEIAAPLRRFWHITRGRRRDH
jgi:hypothetical protein